MKRRSLIIMFVTVLCMVLLLCSCEDSGADKPKQENDTTPITDANDTDSTVVSFDDKSKGIIEKYNYDVLINAFLSKNVDICAEYDDVEPSMIAGLKSVEFDDYRVFVTKDKNGAEKHIFEFTVVKSEFEALPVGAYSYVLNDSAVVYFKENNTAEDVLNDDALREFVNILSDNCYPVIEDSNSFTYEDYLCGVYKSAMDMSWYVYGEVPVTEDIVKRIINDFFGIENYNIPEQAGYVDSGLCYTYPPYATGKVCELNNVQCTDDQYVIDIQFWGDALRLLPSHKVRYVIEKANNDCGYRLIEIKLLKRGQFEPLEVVI